MKRILVLLTVAATVATNTNAILAGLGQIFECSYVLDHDAPLLERHRPAIF
jgi:hypothetical protein